MNDNQCQLPNHRGLLKPTLQITFFSCLGIFVSFATQIIVAAKFGVMMQRDAYFAAIVVPAYVTAVLLGSLTVTFVPIFIEYETRKSKAEAWKVASIFTNLTFVVLFGISLLAFIFAKQLIAVTAPGFKGEELSLTTTLLQIIFPSIIFTGLTSLLSSIYYAEHRFLRPAIVPVVNAVLMLLAVIFLARYWGIKSLAFGYLIGAVVGFIILVPIFFKQGRYGFSFDFSNEGVRQVIRVMAPLVLAGLFYKATTVIERMIASTLPTGSISYLGYANGITAILGTIATLGISTTIFPVMARSWGENDLTKAREYFAKGVRIIMLTTFPIATVFVVLRVPIIQVAFERGTFDHKATVAVANVLSILMLAFITSGLGTVVGKGFYIAQKTKLLAVLGIAQTLAYLCLAYLLSSYFSYIGLALATSIYFTLGLIVSLFVMKRIYYGINAKIILEGFGKILLSSVIAGIGTYCCFKLMPSKFSLFLRGNTAGASGIAIYVYLTTHVLRLDEAVSLEKKIIEEIRRRFSFGNVQSRDSETRVESIITDDKNCIDLGCGGQIHEHSRMMTVLKCPICSSKDTFELFEGKDRLLHLPGRFYVMKCRSCEILFTYPFLTVDELGTFYPNDYHVFNTHQLKHGTDVQGERNKSIKHRIGVYVKKIYSTSLYRTLHRRTTSDFLKGSIGQLFCLPFRKYVHTFPPYKSKPGRLLDIGCATGSFLRMLRRAGWEVFGIETDKNACFHARETMKLNVFHGDLLQAKYDSEYFDVINMSHVLEHFPNPLDELKETYRILKKNGILIIGLPNLSKLETGIFGKYWYAWDLPRHRFHFSVKTLRNLLDEGHFKIAKVYYSTDTNNFIGSCRYYLEDKGFPKYLSDFFNINNRVLLRGLKPLGYFLKVSKQSGRISLYCLKK